MTNNKAIWTFIGALVFSLILMFGHSVTSYSKLQRYDWQVLEDSKRLAEESRRYTDNRIIESQQQTLAAISDVSKTTKLLTKILCQTQFDKNECDKELGRPKEN